MEDASSSAPTSPTSSASVMDVALRNMIPAWERSKKDNIPTQLLHDMDNKYVQTVMSEMIDGDTLIVIDVPPAHQPNRSCTGARFPLKYRIRCHSGLLRLSGLKLLCRLIDDVKYQSKLFARLVSTEGIPDGVVFVLRLGPSMDEDLQSAHLQTLTLSKGIIRWYKTGTANQEAGKYVVQGHDDCCTCGGRAMPPTPSSPSFGETPHLITTDTNLWNDSVLPDHREIEDYCEVRHAANVVRLLRHISGRPSGELLLDSAPRVFTICGLAKLLEADGTNDALWLHDAVNGWFFANGNGKITEILAEDSIVMGYQLQLRSVTQASFRALVNEHALQLESGLPAPPGGHKYSVCGRPLRDINDDIIQTAIEHAGQALVERILAHLAMLESDEVFESLGLHEWSRIMLLEKFELEKGKAENLPPNTPESQSFERLVTASKDLKQELLRLFRCRIADPRHLQAGPPSAMMTHAELFLRTFVPKQRHVRFEERWATLNDNQKALTSVFWRTLSDRAGKMVAHNNFGTTARCLVDRFNSAVHDCAVGRAILEESESGVDESLLVLKPICQSRPPGVYSDRVLAPQSAPFIKHAPSSQLPSLTPLQIPSLTPSQLLSLTPSQLLAPAEAVALSRQRATLRGPPEDVEMAQDAPPPTSQAQQAVPMAQQAVPMAQPADPTDPTDPAGPSQLAQSPNPHGRPRKMRQYFKLDTFLRQLTYNLQLFCKPMCHPDIGELKRDDMHLTNSYSPLLLPLSENETMFLPIWAGGKNDESGAAYETAPPPSEMGPSGPGPSYHTGLSAASSMAASSSSSWSSAGGSTIGDMGLDGLEVRSLDSATISGSVSAQASRGSGTATTAGTASSIVGRMDELDFADARFQVPADHQAQGQAIAAFVHDYQGAAGGAREDDDGDSDMADFGLNDFEEEEDDDDSSTISGFSSVG